MRKRSKLRRVFTVASIMALVFSSFPTLPAYAGSNLGPDPDLTGADNGTGPQNIMGYAISYDNYTNIGQNHLKIYAKSDRIAVFIAGSDLCPDSEYVHGTWDSMYSGAGSVAYGSQVATYTLKNTPADSGNTGTGAKRTASFCSTGNGQSAWPGAGDSTGTGYAQTTLRLVRVANKQLSGRDDIYEYDLDVAWDANGNCGSNCGLNSYRIKVLNYPTGNNANYGNGANIWVSQDPTVGANQFGINPGQRPDSNFFSYTVEFGPDCTLTTQSATRRIVVYDDDNAGGSAQTSIQPGNNPFEVRVLRKPRTSGTWAPISLARSSPAGLDRNTALANGWYAVGTYGDQHKIYLDFNVNVDYIYRFQVKDLYWNNTLQYQLPYASVWGEPAIQCQKRASPSVTMPATVDVGDSVSASFSLVNRSAGNQYDGKFNYRRYFWCEAGPTNGYNYAEGDRLVGTPECPGTSYGQNNGTWYGPATVSGGSNTTLPGSPWSVVAPGGFKSICGWLYISADSNNASVYGAPSDMACTLIGKYPSMAVTGGDVRTGGGFYSAAAPYSGCNATTGGGTSIPQYHQRLSVVGHDYTGAAPYHSRAQYAVFSAGIVRNFASQTLSNSSSSLLTFGAPTPSLAYGWDGLFYQSQPASTTFATHCLSPIFANGRYPALATATTDNLGTAASMSRTITPGQSYIFDFNTNQSNQTLILSGVNLGPGQKTVIRVNNSGGGTNNKIRLGGNITYAATTYTTLDDLPQFVLLTNGQWGGGGIQVASGVTRLDGIYGLNGTQFDTCHLFNGSTLGINSGCGNQLTVNGAVITRGMVRPYRTAGHDAAGNSDPAEIFNLRPDVMLGDYARNGSGAGNITTISQTELAPRY